MARSGFRRPRRSLTSRFAKKKLIWCSSSLSTVEVAGTTTIFNLLVPQQWQLNTTSGDLESAKILRLVLVLTAVQIATRESRVFNLSVNDINQPAQNPFLAAAYNDIEPFHIGFLDVSGVAAGLQAQSNNFHDNVRVFKVNRKIRSDMNLNLMIQPAAAAPNQLTFSLLARTLVQLD